MLAHRLRIRNYGRDTESLAIPIGLAGLPGSFLPILGLTGRLAWRIRRAEAAPYAPETTPKFTRPALQP